MNAGAKWAPLASKQSLGEASMMGGGEFMQNEYLDQLPTLSVPQKQRASIDCKLDPKLSVAQVSY